MRLYGISVRQPLPGDIVSDRLKVAALGTAYEATFVWRLVRGHIVLSQGHFTAGSPGVMQTLLVELPLDPIPPAGPAFFELTQDWGADEAEAAAPEPVRVPVIVIPGATGYVPYEVRDGDVLSDVVQRATSGTTISTVGNTVIANGIDRSWNLRPGEILRIPV